MRKQQNNNNNNSRSGPLEKNNLLEQRKCGLPAERTCVTQRRKARTIKTEERIAAHKQEPTNIHHKITVRAIKSCHTKLPPPGLDISHANTMREKNQNKQKLKTQRMKILTPGETFIISTALVSINIKRTKNLLRAPMP